MAPISWVWSTEQSDLSRKGGAMSFLTITSHRILFFPLFVSWSLSERANELWCIQGSVSRKTRLTVTLHSILLWMESSPRAPPATGISAGHTAHAVFLKPPSLDFRRRGPARPADSEAAFNETLGGVRLKFEELCCRACDVEGRLWKRGQRLHPEEVLKPGAGRCRAGRPQWDRGAWHWC